MSSSHATADVAQPMGHVSQRNQALMRRFVEQVINQGDEALLDELLHRDYVYRAPGQELHGAAALRALFAAYRAGLPDLHIEVDELIVTDDRAALAFTLTGTHRGSLMGIAATGKPVSINGTLFSRFADGCIVEEWEVIDQLSLLTQLGVVSLPA